MNVLNASDDGLLKLKPVVHLLFTYGSINK